MIGRNLGGANGAGGGSQGPRGSTPTRKLGSGADSQQPNNARNINSGGSHQNNGPNGNKLLQRQDSAVTQKANQAEG